MVKVIGTYELSLFTQRSVMVLVLHHFLILLSNKKKKKIKNTKNYRQTNALKVNRILTHFQCTGAYDRDDDCLMDFSANICFPLSL